MNRYFNRNRDDIEIKVDHPLNSLANFGGTITVDQDFDIKNYLNSIEGGDLSVNKKQKKDNVLNSTSQFTTFNSNAYPKNTIYNGYLMTFNNVPSTKAKFKKSGASFSSDLTKKKYLNTTTSSYLEHKYNNKNNYITNTNNNFLSTKNTSKLLYKRNKNLINKTAIQSNENFNVFKAIKEIKKSAQLPKIYNMKKNSNKKLFITNNNQENKKTPLAYSKEYVDIVFDSKRLINYYNFRKGLDLDPPENLVSFSSKKKEISVNNVLIDLLHNETERLSVKEKIFKARNEKNKNALNNNIKDFEDFTDEQKQVCKSIENCYDKLLRENNILLNELIKYKSINKSYADDIQKVLEQIENLRVYALFVHQSLEKDISRFEKSIFPDYRSEKLVDYNKKIETIRNFVINNYSIFWEPRYAKELEEDLEYLKNPDLLLQKLHEIEGNIMRLLEFKDNLIKESEEEEKKHEIILGELKSRYEDAKIDYKKNSKKLKFELSQIDNLKKKEVDHNSEFIELIGILFLNIVEVFGKNDKYKNNYKSILNGKIDKDNISICLKEGRRLLRENEDLLNNTLLAIKSYQEKDERFFNQVMDETKQKNKAQKHLMYKKNKMDMQFENEVKFIHKTNKIKILSRKTEAPYHSPQKKVKKVINLGQIKRLEDEELLKYQ
jgi:hypothetical protein